jgi:hypothetical protein
MSLFSSHANIMFLNLKTQQNNDIFMSGISDTYNIQ